MLRRSYDAAKIPIYSDFSKFYPEKLAKVLSFAPLKQRIDPNPVKTYALKPDHLCLPGTKCEFTCGELQTLTCGIIAEQDLG